MTGRVDNPSLSLPEKVRALFTSFKGIFAGALATAPSNAMKFATKVQSTSVSNTYAWLGQSASFRKWVGARVSQAVAKFAYMITNVTWEMTETVPKENIDDDNLGLFTPLVADMAESAARDVDFQIFGAIKNGHVGLCFDGLPYFSTAHPTEFGEDGVAVEGSPTYSNLLAVTGDGAVQGEPWYVGCTARQIKPIIYQERQAPNFVSKTALTDENVFHSKEFIFGSDKRDAVGYTLPQLMVKCTVPLTAANFATAVNMIEAATGDKGKPLGLTVTDMACGTAMRADAMTLLSADRLSAGQTNIWKNYCALTVTSFLNP